MLKWDCLSYNRGSMTEFNKAALTAEEQLNLLISRGLLVEDKTSAVDILKRIGYYRLSAYMRYFQQGVNHEFVPNTNFANIIELYNFDEKLRSICFDSIRKIEIAYRAAISNVMCKKYGSHWFYNQSAFKDSQKILECRAVIESEIKKKNSEYAETFIAKYYKKYDNPDLPPFWTIAETLTIGSLNKIYQMISNSDKREIIKYLGFSFDIKFLAFANWLFSVCVIRNICAHHSRLFNRIFRISPTKQALIKELNTDYRNTFYYLAMIINYYLKTISNDISFEDDLIRLFAKYPNIDKTKMGIPANWQGFTITKIGKQKVKSNHQ